MVVSGSEGEATEFMVDCSESAVLAGEESLQIFRFSDFQTLTCARPD